MPQTTPLADIKPRLATKSSWHPNSILIARYFFCSIMSVYLGQSNGSICRTNCLCCLELESVTASSLLIDSEGFNPCKSVTTDSVAVVTVVIVAVTLRVTPSCVSGSILRFTQQLRISSAIQTLVAYLPVYVLPNKADCATTMISESSSLLLLKLLRSVAFVAIIYCVVSTIVGRGGLRSGQLLV